MNSRMTIRSVRVSPFVTALKTWRFQLFGSNGSRVSMPGPAISPRLSTGSRMGVEHDSSELPQRQKMNFLWWGRGNWISSIL